MLHNDKDLFERVVLDTSKEQMIKYALDVQVYLRACRFVISNIFLLFLVKKSSFGFINTPSAIAVNTFTF